ncbi:MAG: phospholipase D-like domain-containing protein [Oligoflexia bacterium]|nr:phospholipase D-like domain-containing protein [Oligoflexia bacterium]
MSSSTPRWILIAFLNLALATAGCSSPSHKGAQRQPGSLDRSAELQGPDYPRIFRRSREVLRSDDPKVQKRLSKANVESRLIELLQNEPARIDSPREELLKAVAAESAQNPDPTKHLRLIPPRGQPGYSELKFHASHPYYLGKSLVRESDLVQVWRDFLEQAERQIILNVFDFDLEEVAEDLVRKAAAGVSVRVGIDKNVVALRPEVARVRDRLVSGGVAVTPVNSVSLNHQKLAAIDWEDPEKARVLFSSGNLTQSCLGPEGDLKALPPQKRPPESVPNANHVLTMRSWLLANLVQHELTKTLDPAFLFRGASYPTTGSFQVTGPGVPPETLEAYPEHSLIITFAPGGGYRNINQNLIAHFIKSSQGPVRLLQFAYSSEEVATALRERALREHSRQKSFDFLSVGDTPFAMQPWSQFLLMSGMKQVKLSKKKKTYEEDAQNAWHQELSPAQLDALRPQIRIAPPEYNNHHVKIDGTSHAITAKIHHKVLATGPYVILGTSFNFSQAAQTNNEQILVFRDPDLVQAVLGMTRWLAERSPRSVYEEAMRRNQFGGPAEEAEVGSEDLGAQQR